MKFEQGYTNAIEGMLIHLMGLLGKEDLLPVLRKKLKTYGLEIRKTVEK